MKGLSTRGILWTIHLYILVQGVEMCYNNDGYISWSHGNRELCCPDECRSQGYMDRCCACEAKPCWQLVQDGETNLTCPDTLGRLHVEMEDAFGNSRLVVSQNATVFELVHRNAHLVKLPKNICDFNNTLVKLDLAFNKIKDISKIQCLPELDSIILDNNSIKEITNKTFSSMKNLRVLSMRNNVNIMKLEPNVINIGDQNIYIVDLSENWLDSVDVTNIFRPGPFCSLNISNGTIGNIFNENHYKINVRQGPGDIFLEDVGVVEFFNFTDLGLDYSEMPKYLEGHLNMDKSIMCDCFMHPIAEWFVKWVHYWPNIGRSDFLCNKPELMKGKSIKEVVEAGELYRFACELKNCPTFCSCIDMPSKKKIVVNCSDQALTEFPAEMPVGYWGNNRVELLMSRNRITAIPARYYMDKLVGLDLSGNEITYINTKSVENLQYTNIPKDGMIISDQNVQRLDPSFQAVDPRVFVFGDNPVVCDCGNLWIGDWIRVNNAFGRLRCKTSYGVTLAEDVTSETLDCIENTVQFAYFLVPSIVVVALLLLTIILSFVFRYELIMVFRKVKRNYPESNCEIDVFLSICEDNDAVLKFIRYDVLSALQKNNYSVYLPYLHAVRGDRDSEILKGIQISKNFVIVLSQEYGQNYASLSEFKTLWKWYSFDKSREITVINFDHIEAGHIPNRKLRAVKRFSRRVDFKDRNVTFAKKLEQALGKPMGKKLDPKFTVFSSKKSVSRSTDVINHGRSSTLQRNTVFQRLTEPKPLQCNCKYHKCYVHP